MSRYSKRRSRLPSGSTPPFVSFCRRHALRSAGGPSISAADANSRGGSCSAASRLSFALRLLGAEVWAVCPASSFRRFDSSSSASVGFRRIGLTRRLRQHPRWTSSRRHFVHGMDRLRLVHPQGLRLLHRAATVHVVLALAGPSSQAADVVLFQHQSLSRSHSPRCAAPHRPRPCTLGFFSPRGLRGAVEDELQRADPHVVARR